MGDYIERIKEQTSASLGLYGIYEYGLIDFIEDGETKLLITVPCDSHHDQEDKANDFSDFSTWFEDNYDPYADEPKYHVMDIVLVVKANEV